MSERNDDMLSAAVALVAAGEWRVDTEAGLVYGKRGRPFTSTRRGYVQCAWAIPLDGGNRTGNVLAHRLVWAVATGQLDAPCINHLNGDKSDNRLCNLEGVTLSENTLHAIATGLRPRLSGACARQPVVGTMDTEAIRLLVQAGAPRKDIAEWFGVSISTVNWTATGRR